MAGLTKPTKEAWEAIIQGDNIIAETYRGLLKMGVSASGLMTAEPYIKQFLSILPYAVGECGDELHDLFVAKIKELDSAKKHYEEKFATRDKEIKDKENELRKREYDLMNKRCRLDKELYELRKRAEAAEEMKEYLDNVETPEAKDRIRIAKFYLSQVEHNKWNDKAIAWSLGAILSGTQMPNFGKSEKE